MAILATTTVDQTLVANNQKVAVVLTISNTGGAGSDVASIQPIILPNLNTGLSPVPVGAPSATKTVPANSSLSFAWLQTFFANLNQVSSNPEQAYNVGALVIMSDGTVVNANQAVVQVVPPIAVTPTFATGFPTLLSSNIPSGVYAGSLLPGLAPAGAIRFDYNFDLSLSLTAVGAV